MKKIFIFVLVIGVLSLGYWFVSPFFINNEINESLPTVDNSLLEDQANNVDQQIVKLKQGQFTGFDKVHTGSGTASVIKIGDKNYIRFEEDFVVNNGPDLYVGLGENGKYIKGSELGKLKGNIGAQNYELPPDVDPAEVWVWCKAFSVPFTKAVLN